MGNDGFRHRIEIRKNESFKEVFINFMISLGFDKKKVRDIFWNPETNKYIKIKEVYERVSHDKNKDFDVDVFYGAKKIILLVRTKKRAKLIRVLEKYSKWDTDYSKDYSSANVKKK